MITLFGSEEIEPLGPVDLLQWFTDLTPSLAGIAEVETGEDVGDDWFVRHTWRPRRPGACPFGITVPPVDDPDYDPVQDDERAGAGPLDEVVSFADLHELQLMFEAVAVGRVLRWEAPGHRVIDVLEPDGGLSYRGHHYGTVWRTLDLAWRIGATRTTFEPWTEDRLTVHRTMYREPVTTTAAPSLDALARFGHALSDPTRARILMALRESPAHPADLADTLGVSRQSTSNHLACLRGCGLVVAVQQGRRTRYELADARLGHALGDLLDLVLAVDPEACDDAATQDCC